MCAALSPVSCHCVLHHFAQRPVSVMSSRCPYNMPFCDVHSMSLDLCVCDIHSFDNLSVPFQWLPDWIPLCLTASVDSECCICSPLLSASLYPFRCSVIDRGPWLGCLLLPLRYLTVNKKVLRGFKSRPTYTRLSRIR